MSIVLERIKQYCEFKGLSSREFSLSVGRSAGYFTTALKQGSEPTADMLSKIFETYPSLNVKWVFSGNGDMEYLESDYQELKSIDELIDEKIDKRLRALSEGIRELIINEMEDELERAKKEIDKSKENGSVN